jgi:ABC-type multidrug transport system fused ATPase/permease subunit
MVYGFGTNITSQKNICFYVIFIIIFCWLVFTIFLSTLALYLGALKAARIMHLKVLRNMLKAPMSFFETIPLGRIINRFSKDIDVIDNDLPVTLRACAGCCFGVNRFLFVIFFGGGFLSDFNEIFV